MPGENDLGTGGVQTLGVSGAAALPVESPLTDASQAGGGDGEGSQEQYLRQSGRAPAAAPPPAPEQSVPLSRFSEIAHKNRVLEAKLGSMEETIGRLRGALGGGDEPGASKAERERQEQELYADPVGFIDKRVQGVSAQTQAVYSQVQEAMGYNDALKTLRSIHGLNSDVEEKVADAILRGRLQTIRNEHGIQDRGLAIQAGYRIVTGEELGSKSPAGQSQTQIQRDLTPPSGGGGERTYQGADQGSLLKMTPQQVEKVGAEQWFNQVMAAAQQPT